VATEHHLSMFFHVLVDDLIEDRWIIDVYILESSLPTVVDIIVHC